MHDTWQDHCQRLAKIVFSTALIFVPFGVVSYFGRVFLNSELLWTVFDFLMGVIIYVFMYRQIARATNGEAVAWFDLAPIATYGKFLAISLFGYGISFFVLRAFVLVIPSSYNGMLTVFLIFAFLAYLVSYLLNTAFIVHSMEEDWETFEGVELGLKFAARHPVFFLSTALALFATQYIPYVGIYVQFLLLIAVEYLKSALYLYDEDQVDRYSNVPDYQGYEYE